MSTHSPSSVLYYPSIEFLSEDWVKRALLYWDHVYRIVPREYTPNDSNEIKLLRDEDLIRDIHVSDGEKEKAALGFLKFYKSLQFKPAGLSEQTDSRISLDKVDIRLYPLLEKISQEVRTDESSTWFYISEQVARGYMFMLSQTAAESRQLVRATDQIDMWSIAPYFTERGNFPFEDVSFNEQNKGVYASMMLDDVLPSNVGQISARDIADFNIKRRIERSLFRDKISELVERLPHIKSEEQWGYEIQDKLDEIEQAKSDFRKSQEFWNSAMPSSIFGIGIPLTLTAWGLVNDMLGKLGGTVLGAIATLMDYRKVKLQRNPSYESYLVGVDNISANSVSSHASSVCHEFLND